MIDTRNTVKINEDEQFELPPPARFDDDASANAQPVLPLPNGGVAQWAQHSRHAPRRPGGRVKSLALVVIAGLTIGVASGAMLASRHQAYVSTQAVQQSNVKSAGNDESSDESSPARDMIGAEASVMAMQSAVQPVRIRRHRSSLRQPGQPRAYRVAVLN